MSLSKGLFGIRGKKAERIREQVFEIVTHLGKDGAYRDESTGISMDYQMSTPDKSWIRDCIIMQDSNEVFHVKDQVCRTPLGEDFEDYIYNELRIRTFKRGDWEGRIDDLKAEVMHKKWDTEYAVSRKWHEERMKRLRG